MGFNGLGRDLHLTIAPEHDLSLYVTWGNSIDNDFGEDRGAQYIAGNAIESVSDPSAVGGRLDIVSQGKEVDFFGFARYCVTLCNRSKVPIWFDLQGGGF